MIPDDAPANPADAPVEIAFPAYFNYYRLPPDTPDREAALPTIRSRCERALDAVARGDRDTAREHLEIAAEFAPDFPDLWLALAALSRDSTEQRDYLDRVLIRDPHNPEAIKALAHLRGRYPESAPDDDAELAPDETTGQQIACPQCGGRLIHDAGAAQVTCGFCGHLIVDFDELHATAEQTPLLLGMLRRADRPADWNIGVRWLHCSNCGAATTFHPRSLNAACRFCGQHTVIQENVNHVFEEPSEVVPFRIDEEAARQQAAEAFEREPGFFEALFAPPPRITSLDVQGAYLPFWVFDAQMGIHWHLSRATMAGEDWLDLHDVLFFAATTPARALLERVEPFNLAAGVDYTPHLLADFPAQLPDIDLDRAALDVRGTLHRLAMAQMRRDAELLGGYTGRGGNVDVSPYTIGLSYRLALLPVWIVHALAEDGTTRVGVINGQTGILALQ